MAVSFTKKKRSKKVDLEAIFALGLKALNFPKSEREYCFHPTRKWRFDFAWPAIKLAVEIEGGTGVKGRHVRPEGFRNDCIKYNEAVILGWFVLRGDSQMVKSGSLLKILERKLQGFKDVGAIDFSIRSGSLRGRPSNIKRATRKKEEETKQKGKSPARSKPAARTERGPSGKKSPGISCSGKSVKTTIHRGVNNMGNKAKNLSGHHEEMQAIMDQADIEAAKYDGGNKSAGVRYRNHMQALKNMAQQNRVFVLENNKKEE